MKDGKDIEEKFKSFQYLYCQFVIKELKILLTSFLVKDDEKIGKRLDDILAIICSIILQLFRSSYDKKFQYLFSFFSYQR